MKNPYLNLIGQTLIGGIIMYFVMFTMIATTRDFYNNLNTFYMALMMVAPMVVIMILAMRDMYPSKRANLGLIVGAIIVFTVSFALMRTQGGVGDKQFLRSMIPHHSGALLMCEQSTIRDPRILDLCARILRSQQAEIDEMKAIMATPVA